MAEAFFRQVSKTWKAVSAGIEPDENIHPLTVETMKEVGIDVSRRKPKRLTTAMLKQADRVIVMDSQVLEGIPSPYRSKTVNWGIQSLLGKHEEQVRQVRDEIRRRVDQLSKELSTGK